MSCIHPHFMADVDVNRVTDEEGNDVSGYLADVRINCAVCGLQFVFACRDYGLLPDRPAIAIDGSEIHLPIAPSDDPDMRLEVGFRVSSVPPKASQA